MTEQVMTQRDHLIDNLRFILIVMVVIGHFIEPYINQAAFFKVLFICIYSFHIPMFVFISGYLSKSDSSLKPNKAVSTLLLPYLIFSLLWRLRETAHTGMWNMDLLSPTFHLWYLLSLFTWKMILPFIRAVKHHLFLSFVISLIVGLSPSISNNFSLGRTLSLLPFFVLGTHCSATNLYYIHKSKYLAISGFVLMTVIAYVLIHYNFNYLIEFWLHPYHIIGYSNAQGILVRLILMATALIFGMTIIILTPKIKTFYTLRGAKTLVIYIFHGFLVKPFSIRFPLWNQNWLTNILIVMFPLMVIYVLSLPVVSKMYDTTIGRLCQKAIENEALKNKLY